MMPEERSERERGIIMAQEDLFWAVVILMLDALFILNLDI